MGIFGVINISLVGVAMVHRANGLAANVIGCVVLVTPSAGDVTFFYPRQ